MAAKKVNQQVEWDQGIVHYIITDHKGKESLGQQMCWNKKLFVDNQTAQALASQLATDESQRYKFRAVSL